MISEQDNTKETEYFTYIYNTIFQMRRKEIFNELMYVEMYVCPQFMAVTLLLLFVAFIWKESFDIFQ
jgi:hypothetical protein